MEHRSYITTQFVPIADYKPGATRARLYVRNMEVCSIEVRNDQQDSEPNGTAIARLWNKFEREVGKDIRRLPQVEEST